MSNRFSPAAAGLPGSTASTSRPTPSGRSSCSRTAAGTGANVVPRRRGLAAGRAGSAGRLSAAPRGSFPSSASSKGRRGGVSAFGGIGSIRGRPGFASRRLGASVSSARARGASPAVTMTATMATRAASIRPVKRPSQIVDLMKSPLFPQEKSRPGNRKPAGPTPCYRRRGDGAQGTRSRKESKREDCLVAHFWVILRRGRQKFRRSYGASSLLKRSPIPASPVRLKEAISATLDAVSEGSPVLREPASPVSEARRAKAIAARRERRARMPVANSAGGTGDPEACQRPSTTTSRPPAHPSIRIPPARNTVSWTARSWSSVNGEAISPRIIAAISAASAM